MRALLPLVLVCACGPELNPTRPPPAPGSLAEGVWVAYNLGCERGCDQIRRGDRIVAVDGRRVDSGAELDAIGLVGERRLRVVPYGSTGARDVTLVAAPRDDLPPIAAAPPLFTVGAEALDRAPPWARDRLFGHAIPALRFHRADEPRGYVTGRELYGRGALLLVWEYPVMIRSTRQSFDRIPDAYALLQAHADALQAAGVDPYFVTDFRAEPALRDHARSRLPPGAGDPIPIFQLSSNANNPNTLGIEGGASDIREWLFDYSRAPVLVVLDRRGIVRFHARGFPIGLEETLAAAIDFATTSLVDGPPVTPPPASPEPSEPPPAP